MVVMMQVNSSDGKSEWDCNVDENEQWRSMVGKTALLIEGHSGSDYKTCRNHTLEVIITTLRGEKKRRANFALLW